MAASVETNTRFSFSSSLGLTHSPSTSKRPSNLNAACRAIYFRNPDASPFVFRLTPASASSDCTNAQETLVWLDHRRSRSSLDSTDASRIGLFETTLLYSNLYSSQRQNPRLDVLVLSSGGIESLCSGIPPDRHHVPSQMSCHKCQGSMKFNIVLGLTTILYMAPNAVAWNLPAALVGNNRLEATPTAQPSGGVEPTGTLPTGTFPSGGFGGAVPSGGFGGGAAPSGGFGGGAAPSGGFGGHHGHHGHGGGEAPSGSLPTGGPQPSGGASSFEGGVSLIGGESGEGEGQGNGGEAPVPTAASSGAPSGAPSGVPSGFPGGGFEGQSSFGSASPPAPTGSSVPSFGGQGQYEGEGGNQGNGQGFKRFHARQIRPIQA
ncbi:hypothetical protein VI817_002217 [Penicillium citrinum]|nr:hypothetical protein VI817_002217 [Penicillium citrinum]